VKCPRCGHRQDRVVQTRPQRRDGSIRRHRVCLACGAAFTTHERTIDPGGTWPELVAALLEQQERA
jgi:transcriptional regulator NrdR family protein